MLRTRYWALALLAAVACGPSVSLSRTVPPPHNLGAVKRLVLVEARGNRDLLPAFVSAFTSKTNGGGFFRLLDGTSEGTRLSDLTLRAGSRRAAAYREDWPADAYVGLNLTGCRSEERREDYKDKDKDGNKITKTRYWAWAECEAEIEIVDGRDGHEVASYGASSSATSPRGDTWRRRMAEEALERAAVAAAAHAVDGFTPRRVSETIALEKDAPDAKPGIERIEAGRYDEVREIWERALEAYPDSAPLHYNLGAVCEVLGATTPARHHYEEAIRLTPGEKKYREALDDLQQRLDDAEALRKRR